MAASRHLVLGAGLVSRPLIEYLSRDAARAVVVASASPDELAAVRKAFAARPNVEAARLDVAGDAPGLAALVGSARVVTSLLPAAMHGAVADAALRSPAPPDVVTASYVGDMADRDAEARSRGVRIVCEAGLDPGMDHMAAVKLVHEAAGRGEVVTAFRSVCGGLPAPDVAAEVPGLRYKFSWSPRGALAAAFNAASWVEDGRLVEVPGSELLASAVPVDPSAFAAFGDFDLECLPNRDSRPYRAKYGLDDAATVFRGTLRYRGGSAALKGLADLGLLDDVAAAGGETSTARRSNGAVGAAQELLDGGAAAVLLGEGAQEGLAQRRHLLLRGHARHAERDLAAVGPRRRVAQQDVDHREGAARGAPRLRRPRHRFLPFAMASAFELARAE